MSAENVEIVARMLDAWVRRDYEAVLPAFDPDVVLVATEAAGPDNTGAAFGTDEVSRVVERWRGTWAGFEFTTEELIDAGDHVIHVTHHRGRGKGSGVEVESDYATIFTLLGGRIIWCKIFGSKEEALAAAGREQ